MHFTHRSTALSSVSILHFTFHIPQFRILPTASHVSSRSGEACCELLYSVYLYPYLTNKRLCVVQADSVVIPIPDLL